MPNECCPEVGTDQPMIYQIRIQGHLGRQWAERFEDLSIDLEDDGSTLLTGLVVDQAALHGILRRIRDLGVALISVNSIGAGPDSRRRSNKGSDGPSTL